MWLALYSAKKRVGTWTTDLHHTKSSGKSHHRGNRCQKGKLYHTIK